ncbi:MAG: choice-of-anchor tandem repeat GloVer-containing protein, partial [Candidatus Cybelea sp.]
MRRQFLALCIFNTVAIAGCSSAGVPYQADRAAVEIGKPAKPFEVLHIFKDGNDGAEPEAALLLDHGALYGTTYRGGDRNDGGTVYKVTPSGGYSIIHRFVRHAPFGQRANPDGGLVSDTAGDLYGTTLEGGLLHRGTVYKVNARGRATTLYTFCGGSDGEFPYAT